MVFRRRRKRRDQTSDGKEEKPQNFNLPQIPHCYSTAASYAASSLSHKFSDEVSSSTYSDMQLRREEDDGVHQQYNIPHSSPISESDVTNQVDLNIEQTSQLGIQENTETLPTQEGIEPKSSRLHSLSQNTDENPYHDHQQPSAPPPSAGRITRAVTSTIIPDFRPASSQTQLDVARYSGFANIATYSPSVLPQSSPHYAPHYSLGHTFSTPSAPVVNQSQYNSDISSQLAQQRPFNFSVNHLIQRSYPKM